ncbi:MAG: urea ABC transporter permease subunit UrtB [Sneathiella sp.]|nr:urea ABC transporter permease subunit UrtB [Sneathiella sp.]
MKIIKKAILLLSTLTCLVLTGATLGAASELYDVTQELNTKSYSKKAKVVAKIAETGDEQAADILRALMAGDLFARKSDKIIVLAEKQPDGGYALIAPGTGAALGTAKKSDLSKVKINNRVRNAIKAALGGLDLNHPDPAKRLAAADAVFKSLDDDMLPLLEARLKTEENDKVKSAFEQTIAALYLNADVDFAAKVSALHTLKESGGPEVKSFLSRYLAELPEEEAELRSQVAEILDAVERRLSNFALVENLFQGLSLGSVLLLAAIGLAITFGVMGVINMAHGEMVMIGAYTTYVIQEICRTSFPAGLEYSLIVAIPAAFVVAGFFGVLLEKSVIRFLYGRPLETLLATWGVSLILQQFVRTIFGPTNKEVSAPSWLSGAWEVTSGLSLTYNRIAIIIFALCVLFALMLVLKKTLFGLQMRAVTQNRQMARSMGVESATVDSLTFGLGSGIAGMAGVALSQIDNVSPNLGQAYIIDSFMVVVFGGVGNLWGTLVGAGSLGIVNKFLEPYSGAVLAKILVLVAIILFIQKRPRGLFALKGRSVEG